MCPNDQKESIQKLIRELREANRVKDKDETDRLLKSEMAVTLKLVDPRTLKPKGMK